MLIQASLSNRKNNDDNNKYNYTKTTITETKQKLVTKNNEKTTTITFPKKTAKSAL